MSISFAARRAIADADSVRVLRAVRRRDSVATGFSSVQLSKT
jgi:hypothetical protein